MPIDAFAALNAMVRAEVARTDPPESPREETAVAERKPSARGTATEPSQARASTRDGRPPAGASPS
ncbi:hypothetical protein ABZ532_14900 [Streptomyces sp. NPDC019396]|uniref:hypothetical protein n=1 Tax=Streptomyces sp. NPDC019396 TaxID=3154687 RepID=UPI0033C58130